MARVLGRHAGLLTAGLIGIVVIGPIAALAPAWGALALGVTAVVAAGLAQVRAATLRARCDKLSAEIDLLSSRLLKAERAQAAPPEPPPRDEVLRTEVEELTVEIGLLSGILRDLTAVVRSQDGEIARLKALPSPAPPPEPRPAPVEVAPPPAAVPALPVVSAPSTVPAPAPIDPAAGRIRAEPEAAPPARPIPPRRVTAPPPDDGQVLRAFEAGDLEIHLQPIVTLPQRKVVAYEALARLRVGERIAGPQDFLPALERHGRTTELDRRMLQRAATVTRHLARRGSEAGVGYALSPLSLFEPGFLRELGRLAGDDPALAGLTVALSQASWRGLDGGQRDLLAALRGRIGVGLDRADDLHVDARDLAGLGVTQVKVTADLLLRSAPGRSDIAAEDLAPALARAGLRLVAVGVEAEADVPDLIDLDVPFAQGIAFAPPRPVRSEILAAPPPVDPPPAEPPPERRSFRSVLRRAV